MSGKRPEMSSVRSTTRFQTCEGRLTSDLQTIVTSVRSRRCCRPAPQIRPTTSCSPLAAVLRLSSNQAADRSLRGYLPGRHRSLDTRLNSSSSSGVAHASTSRLAKTPPGRSASTTSRKSDRFRSCPRWWMANPDTTRSNWPKSGRKLSPEAVAQGRVLGSGLAARSRSVTCRSAQSEGTADHYANLLCW